MEIKVVKGKKKPNRHMSCITALILGAVYFALVFVVGKTDIIQEVTCGTLIVGVIALWEIWDAIMWEKERDIQIDNLQIEVVKKEGEE